MSEVLEEIASLQPKLLGHLIPISSFGKKRSF